MTDSSLPATSTEDDFVFIELGDKVYKFSTGKNQHVQAKLQRQAQLQLNFESIIFQLAAGNICAIDDYSGARRLLGDRIYVLKIDNYAYEVPFAKEEPNIIFLKDLYPSRKMGARHLGIKRKPKRFKKWLKKNAALSVSVLVETTFASISINKPR